MVSTIVGAAGGIPIESLVVRAINREGSTIQKGELVQFCTDPSQAAEVTGFLGDGTTVTSEADGLANVVHPFSTTSGIFAIAMADVANDAEGEFLVCGVVDAEVLYDSAGSGAIGPGTIVGPRTSGSAATQQTLGEIVASPTAQHKGLGILLENIADQTAQTTAKVFFDGVYGFGRLNA